MEPASEHQPPGATDEIPSAQQLYNLWAAYSALWVEVRSYLSTPDNDPEMTLDKSRALKLFDEYDDFIVHITLDLPQRAFDNISEALIRRLNAIKHRIENTDLMGSVEMIDRASAALREVRMFLGGSDTTSPDTSSPEPNSDEENMAGPVVLTMPVSQDGDRFLITVPNPADVIVATVPEHIQLMFRVLSDCVNTWDEVDRYLSSDHMTSDLKSYVLGADVSLADKLPQLASTLYAVYSDFIFITKFASGRGMVTGEMVQEIPLTLALNWAPHAATACAVLQENVLLILGELETLNSAQKANMFTSSAEFSDVLIRLMEAVRNVQAAALSS